MLQPSS